MVFILCLFLFVVSLVLFLFLLHERGLWAEIPMARTLSLSLFALLCFAPGLGGWAVPTPRSVERPHPVSLSLSLCLSASPAGFELPRGAFVQGGSAAQTATCRERTTPCQGRRVHPPMERSGFVRNAKTSSNDCLNTATTTDNDCTLRLRRSLCFYKASHDRLQTQA